MQQHEPRTGRSLSTPGDGLKSPRALADTSGAARDPRAGDPLLDIGEHAVELVETWLRKAQQAVSRSERASADRLSGLVGDSDGLHFAMRFVDRVMRPESHRAAARQLACLVKDQPLPGFLSAADRFLLRVGGRLAPMLPQVVMPLAARRMRGLVGHLVVDADPGVLASHVDARRGDGFGLNLNLLGEAVLGEAEADRRHREVLRLLDQSDVDYVSVKVSAIASQLNDWDFEGSLQRVVERLRPLFAKAALTRPATFVNLDMEEYHDLELTMNAFMAVLDEPEFHSLDAGIVLQAYLPDSFGALQALATWAAGRCNREVWGNPGGIVKIRLVKGANLAMERVDAALHGWEQAPYATKVETDANYKRCLDWLLTPERTEAIRVGIGSHNLFDVAFALLLAAERGVLDKIECEMLEGMAPAHARMVQNDADGLLLYTPAVAAADFDVAISYLFRRLEENATDENFIHRLFGMAPGSPSMQLEAARFRASLRQRWSVGAEPQRTQQRGTENRGSDGPFANEPDTDPALAANRAWARHVTQSRPPAPRAPLTDDTAAIDTMLAAPAAGADAWRIRPAGERRAVLRSVADELARRRGDLIAAMVHEAGKTFGEADPEVSEAIDFARYYGDRALELEGVPGARFDPLGVVVVVPPWNFPVAIPTGGVTAALAAGNAVVLKPAPETPRCAEIVAECCWAAGIGEDVLRHVRVPDNDTGRHLVTHPAVGGVVLTGAFATAELFRSWRPDLRLFAETSGKNALVITPNADIDLAVADLVASAFGHSGQKCSAASLAICVGDVYDSPRLRRQLTDAVRSLKVGPATSLATTMGPTITEPAGKLLRGLTRLDDGEQWLLEPERVAPATWTPGIRAGVGAGPRRRAAPFRGRAEGGGTPARRHTGPRAVAGARIPARIPGGDADHLRRESARDVAGGVRRDRGPRGAPASGASGRRLHVAADRPGRTRRARPGRKRLRGRRATGPLGARPGGGHGFAQGRHGGTSGDQRHDRTADRTPDRPHALRHPGGHRGEPVRPRPPTTARHRRRDRDRRRDGRGPRGRLRREAGGHTPASGPRRPPHHGPPRRHSGRDGRGRRRRIPG